MAELIEVAFGLCATGNQSIDLFILFRCMTRIREIAEADGRKIKRPAMVVTNLSPVV